MSIDSQAITPPSQYTTLDAEGYELVKNKKRKLGHEGPRHTPTDQLSKLPIHNKFDALTYAKPPEKTDKNKNKIAPINVIINETSGSEHRYADLRATLKTPSADGKTLKFPPIVYKIKKEVMSVRAADLDDYRFILHKLNEKQFQYYLFREEEQRNNDIRLVLRGLPHSISSEEVILELKEKQIEVVNVSQMRSGKDKSLLPLHLVTIRELDKDRIKQVDSIAFIKVRFEDYIPPRGVKQCFKCQRFNHTAKHCHATPRCFKCGEDHESKTCIKTQEDLVKKCVNCGGDHFAMYKGCTAFKAEKVSYAKKVIAATIRANTHHHRSPLLNSMNFPALRTNAHSILSTANTLQGNARLTHTQQRNRSRQNTKKDTKPTNTDTAPKTPKPTNLQKNSTQRTTEPSVSNTNIGINDFTQLLQEACELGGNISAGEIDIKQAYGLVAKMVGKLLNLSLKIANQPTNGHTK